MCPDILNSCFLPWETTIRTLPFYRCKNHRVPIKHLHFSHANVRGCKCLADKSCSISARLSIVKNPRHCEHLWMLSYEFFHQKQMFGKKGSTSCCFQLLKKCKPLAFILLSVFFVIPKAEQTVLHGKLSWDHLLWVVLEVTYQCHIWVVQPGKSDDKRTYLIESFSSDQKAR